MAKCIERACPFPSILAPDAEVPYCRSHYAMAHPVDRYEGVNPFPLLLIEKWHDPDKAQVDAVLKRFTKRTYSTRNSMQPVSKHLRELAYKENRRRERQKHKEQLTNTFSPVPEKLIDTLPHYMGKRKYNNGNATAMPEPVSIQHSQYEYWPEDCAKTGSTDNAQGTVLSSEGHPFKYCLVENPNDGLFYEVEGHTEIIPEHLFSKG